MSLLVGILLAEPAQAQVQLQPIPEPNVKGVAGIDREPILRLEPDGLASYVTSLAFAPDGKTLYAAGYDKVVRVWRLRNDRFVLDDYAFRVPIGPGDLGTINAIALSPDGRWLAVGGKMTARGEAGFRSSGMVVPQVGGITTEMWLDIGTIYLFDTRSREARPLRGHQGMIVGLEFVPAVEGKPLMLVSAARERDASDKDIGVVRVWDVDQGKETTRTVLPPPTIRPGLAVKRQGDGFRVLLAWGDGKLRVWEGGPLVEVEDGLANTTVGFLPAGGFLSGSFPSVKTKKERDAADAQATWWRDVSPPTVETRLRLTRPQGVSTFMLPRAMTLASSTAGGKPDLAALVARHQPAATDPVHYRLLIMDLAAKRVAASTALWAGSPSTPVLAASPGGPFLAVAGGHPEILIYRLPLRDAAEPVQRLRGVGATMRLVSFATNEKKELGLLISERARSAVAIEKGDMVFDFSNRRLVEPNGWKIVTPEGWQVRIRDTVREGETIRQSFGYRQPDRPAEETVDIAHKAAWEITDHAILPPAAPLTKPMLAVAYSDSELGPLLHLYDLRTGSQVREFRGHVERIRCLAASPDGRLLASAADDQTVCLWSLANLGDVLDVKGRLAGVAVKPSDEKETVRVAGVDPGSQAEGKLAVGAIVEKIIRPGRKDREVKTAADFYGGIWWVKPGDPFQVQLRGGNLLAFQANQGIDSQKPLLSLFITRGDRPEARDWLGWNPLGPYDASDRRIERYLGWHSNTGLFTSPVRFADADQYRKDYYKPGILRHLVARAAFQPALDDFKREEEAKRPAFPNLSFWLTDGAGIETPLKEAAPVLVRQPQQTLNLDGLASFALLESATLQVNQNQEEKLAIPASPGQNLAANLQLPRPGVYRLRLALRSAAFRPAELRREFTIRYQPPAPVLEYSPEWRKQRHQLVTTNPAFGFAAQVRPANPAERPSIELRSNGQLLAARPFQGRFEQTVTLKEGENLVEFVARNPAPLAGHEENETTRLTLRVILARAAASQVRLDSLVPLVGNKSLAPLEFIPGRVMTIPTPRFQLRGSVTIPGGKRLKSVTVTRAQDGLGGLPVNMGGIPPGEGTHEFKETLQLVPGRQILRLTATTMDGDETSTSVDVDYRPEPPRLVVDLPPEGQVHYSDDANPKFDLRGMLFTEEDRRPFQVAILVNGKEVASLTERSFAGSGPWPMVVPGVALSPGRNKVAVRINNTWSAARDIERTVDVAPPPRLVEPHSGGKLSSPSTALTIELQQPRDRPLSEDGVFLFVNDRPQPVGTWRLVSLGTSGGLARWHIQAQEIGLSGGGNRITLVFDGRSWNWDVAFEPPPRSSPPEIDVQLPREETVMDPRQAVQFLVRSPSRLQRVDVVLESTEGFALLRRSVDVATQEIGPGGSLLGASIPLRLAPGVNTIRLTAVNEAGEKSIPVSVNYLRQPVRIDLSEPAPQERDGTLVLPALAAQDGRVTLRGHVHWPVEKEINLGGDVLKVYVNGSLARITNLSEYRDGERGFEAEVILTRQENQIEIEVPGLAQEQGSRRRFSAAALHPQPPRRLHLLIVDTVEEDSDEARTRLKERVLYALHAAPNAPTPRVAYEMRDEPIVLTGPDIERGNVMAHLRRIKNKIDQRSAAEGTPPDVVMLYYAGPETVGQKQHALLLPEQRDPRAALTRADLVGMLDETLGTKVMLMDVTRRLELITAAEASKLARWSDDRLAVLRYAWMQPSPIPADLRLIQAVESALSNPSRPVSLADVGAAADSLAQKKQAAENLIFDTLLPAELRALLLTQAP